MLAVLLLAVLPVAAVAQQCCMPTQLQTLQGIYFGYTRTNEPGFEPATVNGITKFTYDYVNQKQKTSYHSLELPDNEGLAFILGDYGFSETVTRFYNVFDDGSCQYEDFEFVAMIPPCFDLIWPLVAEFSLSTDIPAASFGDELLNNYVMVRLPDCFPLVNIATRRNQPEAGMYRWETMSFLNTTVGIDDPSVLDPPDDCAPATRRSQQLPVGFLHHFKKTPSD